GITRFDTSLLSREQLGALEAWVGRGGTLLLAGGPEWKRTFAALPPSLVPVAVSGVRQADVQSLAKISGKPLTGTAPVSDGKALRGQVLAAAGETPLVLVDRVGTGKVVYLAADPSLEPLAGWTGLADLLDRVVAAPAPDQFVNRGNTENMMMNALQQLPGLGLPSPWLMGGILGGYMLLVGPLSYFILKRKDRREWLWVTVPVLSLGFVGAVYSAGFGKQVNLISHLITVTELAPGTGAATMTSYLGVYAPSRDRLDVDLGGTRLVRPLMGFNGIEEGSTRVVYGDTTTVQFMGLNNYSMKGLAAEQDVSVKGGLEVTGVAVDAEGNLTGTVVNRLDRPVRDVRITAGGRWESLGSLEPGQSSGAFRLNLTPQNMMGKGMPLVRAQGGPGDAPDSQRQDDVLQAVFGWEQQVTAGTFLVTGWTDEPVAAPVVTDLGRMTGGTNLIYARAPIPVDPARGEVPPGVVVGTHTGGPRYGRYPGGYSLDQGAHVFSLILPPVDPTKVEVVNLHTPVMGSTRGYTLSVKNQQTGAWVKLENATVQPLSGWQELVGAGGLMEVQVDVFEHMELSAPSVSVKGVSR
ncbi:MAG TPA: hypothetical protein VNT75_23695, partial [Symbiobacteriaceae bacterium]|nr:hypothetical protein [Symbiobacteriaceae bacterium]